MAQIIHDDFGRTKHFVAAAVATLDDFENDLIGLAGFVPQRNGLVPVGIEGLNGTMFLRVHGRPPTGSSMDVYFSSRLKMAEFISHAVLSIPAIFFGVWLIALWRPRSMSFAAKSKRIAQTTSILWILSYVAGVLGFIADYTTFFG